MTILDALHDRDFFGRLPAFADLSTWGRWLVFLKALYGLAMDEAEEAGFRLHTGRSFYAPPPGGWREAAAIVGRQAGKTRIAGTVMAYEAARAALESPSPDGTELYAVGVAQDQRASIRTLHRYAVSPFELAPALKQLVLARTNDTCRLRGGIVLAAYPCRPAALRGIRAIIGIPDELAFFRTGEGYMTDTETLRALRPTLATTAGKLLILSSPYGQSGALFDLFRSHHGRDDSPVLVWQGSAADMNPTLPSDYLNRMREDDPEAYRSEVLGEFRSGVGSLFDPEALEACVDRGTRERLSVPA